MPLTKLSLAGNYLIFPTRESLVIDIPAGDGKIDNPFLQCNKLQMKEIRKASLISLVPAWHMVNWSQTREIYAENYHI
jgi:hypothetical protein